MLAALSFGVSTAGAQADSTARDTTAKDTTAVDTFSVALPVFPSELPPGPLPAGGRHVFNVDSLLFSGAYTLSDLLAHIPGVYVGRGGFFGQAEYVFYAGRGPAGLEVYWDGIPYLPAGRDSVFLDPARIPLAPVQRVEVLALPGVLRVYLVSRRQSSTHATSLVGVATGDRDIARYRGVFARRWRSGAGFSLAGEWHSIDGVPGTSSSGFGDVDLWFNVEYTPSARFGISYQVLSSSWTRDAATARVDRWKHKRRDGVLRLFTAPRGEEGGLGSRFQLALASTSVEGDSAVPSRSSGQVLFDAVHTWRRAQASIAARLSDRRRPFETEARVAWSPVRGVTLAGEARRSRYGSGREGYRARVTGGLELLLGLSLRGDAVWSEDLQAPLLDADRLQSTQDLAWAARWERRWIVLEVGGGRRAGFVLGGAPAGLKPITGLNASAETDYVRIAGALRAVPWLSLAGWYMDPVRGGADFEPPRHARVSATFFSRFLRVFPSTIFALRGELAVESWSAGVGGRTGTSPNRLNGASFAEWNVEMRIGDVTAFWTQRNANAMRAGYVPGLDYPRVVQYWGMQWQFRN